MFIPGIATYSTIIFRFNGSIIESVAGNRYIDLFETYSTQILRFYKYVIESVAVRRKKYDCQVKLLKLLKTFLKTEFLKLNCICNHPLQFEKIRSLTIQLKTTLIYTYSYKLQKLCLKFPDKLVNRKTQQEKKCQSGTFNRKCDIT